ncbi:MAG: hypothetical protein Kow0089_05880 [Desulfobulbaceae bacterium]
MKWRRQLNRRIVILANSIRPGGRCVAGICAETGEWIRPVPRDTDRAVPNVTSISRISLLDLVEVPLAGDRPSPPDRYQHENWFVDSWTWKVVDQWSAKQIKPFIESKGIILHTASDRVDTSYFDSLPPEQWKSLQLVKSKVTFSKDSWDTRRWRASFKDGSGNLLYLKVTDPVISDKLDQGKNVSQKCLLTVSLAGPWAPDDGSQPERCYKLVAGVIEL